VEIPSYPNPESSLTPEGQLGPLSPGEILSKAFSIYRTNARKMWLAVAITVIPAQLLQLAIKTASVPAGWQIMGGKLYLPADNSGGFAATTLITAVIVYLVQLISLGAILRLVLDDLRGETTSLREALGFAVDRVLAMFWVALLVAVTVLIGFLFIIIPGVYFLIGLCIAIPIVIAESLRGTKAMRRSFELVRGRWWATLGRLLLVGLVVAVPAVLLTVLLAPALVKGVGSSSPFLVFLVSAVIGILVSILLTPFTTAFSALIYVDLRARAEGPLDPHALVNY
jgi:Membrane domain of glycerophosphoryl diester phosphodiesterase